MENLNDDKTLGNLENFTTLTSERRRTRIMIENMRMSRMTQCWGIGTQASGGENEPVVLPLLLGG